MGEHQPVRTVRPYDGLNELARRRGLNCTNKPCGVWPTWPESLKKARQRYAASFLSYLKRADTAKRNFIFISHADCIASVLAVLPSKAGHLVESVGYGASVFGAKRSRDPQIQFPPVRFKSEKSTHSLVSADSLKSEEPSTEFEDTVTYTEDMENSASCDVMEPIYVDVAARMKTTKAKRCFWEVQTHGVTMGPRWRNSSQVLALAKKAMKSSSELDDKLFDELLGGLPT
ncbi:unnamed protein product, partial [Polarella glacialis]